MLSGCGQQTVWETVNDPWIEVEAACREVEVQLPPEAALPVLQNPEEGELYICDGYTLMVQTFNGGDLEATIQKLTGFSKKELACIQSQKGAIKRYLCAWSAVGEEGDQVARAVILDDGSYHYTVSVMADSTDVGALAQKWQSLLNSVNLTDIG